MKELGRKFKGQFECIGGKHRNVQNLPVAIYNLTKYKCLPCNKTYSNKIDEKKWFKNTFNFSNNTNKFYFAAEKKFLYLWIYGWEGKV